MKQELICIGCPMGCQLTAEVENGVVTSVTGNTCPRGDAYARRECVAPVRTVTVAASDQLSITSMENDALRRKLESISVETLTPIEAMNALYELKQML